MGLLGNFYPRPPRGGRHVRQGHKQSAFRFLSTPSARRATLLGASRGSTTLISIHALREEGDQGQLLAVDRLPQFLSTPSARRATGEVVIELLLLPISIHALREEGDITVPCLVYAIVISIHALREEGDAAPGRRKESPTYFYPRPPRGGRPTATPSTTASRYFYPRPPRGGRRLRRGFVVIIKRFLSTPSARRATAKTETKSLFSNKLYNILHEFRRALIYNGSKNYPNHAK